MGLDSFKTESSTASSSSNNSGTSSAQKTKTPSIHRDPDEDIPPFFCVVIQRENEKVVTYFGDSAFPESCRKSDETYMASIETEEKFNRFNERCEKLHDCNIETLFETQPHKAADFLDRLDPEKPQSEEVMCAVCDSDIDVSDEDYTKINGELIHADHRVDEVAEELELRV